MPAALTYPGVYVEEIASGVRTISGVATSVTAFIGRALRGPLNTATVINGFGDFETRFGGLWVESALGYAVRDFFANGGGQAVIVRLYHADPAPLANSNPPAAAAAQRPIDIGELHFLAADAGRWGNALRVRVDRDNVSAEAAASLGVAATALFNLTVRDSASGRSERYLNLTVVDSPRRVDRVLSGASSLLRYAGAPDGSEAVEAGGDAISVKEEGLLTAQKALDGKRNSDPSADAAAEIAAVASARTALDGVLNAASQAVSDGLPLTVADFLPAGGEAAKQGLYALEQVDLFNLLCLPPYRAATDTIDVDTGLVSAAAAYCEKRRAMLLLDAPKPWIDKDSARSGISDVDTDQVGTRSRNAALFFPRLRQPNPLRDGQIETFAACGAVAGVFARTDANRGVWKAPAGFDATLVGAPQLAVALTDAENGELNPLGVNCLRALPGAGRVVWGARTLRGADQLADEYKYIPVRRTALYIEESLYRGLKWAVFEPNDEPLWAQIRLNVGAFMHTLFRQGAFQGSSPRDAYFVRCDKETTPQNDINLGIVNVVVGFAPLKPAEFVVLRLQQIAGQIDV
ncbi:phage tail sheath subtilisin-like domain-containing protein [Xanthomonas sp. SI]|uniref:phage tail sheath family protein n=1 Tax=Xanthomonas sp. SI TaxID=2724123 RepID=UPI00163995F1|nr:phage tail sheath subtilisin-like domain-containing protein [Xanthomonas sp. SI]QNH14591.1 Phage tail sheath protein subtilisin-like domain protein [Xanthomonas sp. SI]